MLPLDSIAEEIKKRAAGSGDRSSKVLVCRMAPGDRDILAAICKKIATGGRGLPREGTIYSDNAVSFHPHLYQSGRLRFSVAHDEGSVGPISTNWFTKFFFDVEIDDGGRITSLAYVDHGTLYHELELPPEIGNLGRLNHLSLRNCRSLPHQALAKLPNLETLRLSLRPSDEVLQNSSLPRLPLRMRLPNLKALYLSGNVCLPPPLPFVSWIQEHLPNLESITLYRVTDELAEEFFSDSLDSNKAAAHSPEIRLQKINLQECDVDENQLEAMLFGVLPMVPTISQLWVRNNKIQSLRSIIQRLNVNSGNKRDWLHKLGLRCLDITRNPVEKLISNNETNEEIDAVVGILRAFPTICSLGNGKSSGCYHNDIHHELLLNRAGRILVEGKRCNNAPFPLSLWPRVLERLTLPRAVDQRRDWEWNTADAATGLYYLLHEGPLLLGVRRQWQ